jgi:hypothetical protein
MKLDREINLHLLEGFDMVVVGRQVMIRVKLEALAMAKFPQ